MTSQPGPQPGRTPPPPRQFQYRDAQGRPITPVPGMVVLRGTNPKATPPTFARTWLATLWLAGCIAMLASGATLPFIRSELAAATLGTSLWYYTPRLLPGNTSGMTSFLVIGLITVLTLALGLLLGLMRLIGQLPAIVLIILSSWALITSLFLLLVALVSSPGSDLAPGPAAFLLVGGSLGALLACTVPGLRRGWLRPSLF